MTPLYQAAALGQRDVAELLITKGAAVNARDNKRWTPLGWADIKGRNDVVNLLDKHGARK